MTEQSRLQLELQRQLPEASAAREEAVVGWTTRCEQLQEQLDESTAAAAASDEQVGELQAEHRRELASVEEDRLVDLRNWTEALNATRENSARLEESNAQLSRQLTNAEHQPQLQSEQIGELQAEHQRELASVEEDRLVDERDWTEALNEAEAKEAIALTEAAAAEQECEEHKAQLLQQLKETQAAAGVLEERLREFDDVAAAAAAAAEAEHNRDRANLQRQVSLQSDRLKKSAQEQRATNTKLEEAEGCLREQEAALNASAEELATAREDYATSTDEATKQIDRLLLFIEQLKKSVAAASRESDQKQGEHQSQRTAELFASTTPMSPAPTIVDILREAGRRAVRQCGGVVVWRCGGVVLWPCGGVEVARCGSVVVWQSRVQQVRARGRGTLGMLSTVPRDAAAARGYGHLVG